MYRHSYAYISMKFTIYTILHEYILIIYLSYKKRTNEHRPGISTSWKTFPSQKIISVIFQFHKQHPPTSLIASSQVFAVLDTA